jgi:hypothetical protein
MTERDSGLLPGRRRFNLGAVALALAPLAGGAQPPGDSPHKDQ